MTLLKRTSSLLPDIFEQSFFNADWINGKSWLAQVPPANIVEKDNEFDIELAVPGMSKEDFHITSENGILTISAEKEEKKEEREKDYSRKEYNYNSFTRSFSLPQSVKADQVQAKYENGVLKLTIPKKEEAKAKPKLEVKVS